MTTGRTRALRKMACLTWMLGVLSSSCSVSYEKTETLYDGPRLPRDQAAVLVMGVAPGGRVTLSQGEVPIGGSVPVKPRLEPRHNYSVRPGDYRAELRGDCRSRKVVESTMQSPGGKKIIVRDRALCEFVCPLWFQAIAGRDYLVQMVGVDTCPPGGFIIVDVTTSTVVASTSDHASGVFSFLGFELATQAIKSCLYQVLSSSGAEMSEASPDPRVCNE